MSTTPALTGSARLPVAGQQRHPRKPWALTVITFGIYGAVHHYRKEQDDGRQQAQGKGR